MGCIEFATGRFPGFILSLIPVVLLIVLFGNLDTLDTDSGIIQPKASLYDNKFPALTDYLNLAQKVGYKKYGIYGDVNVSIKQYAIDFEGVDASDSDLYPSWMASDKKLGLVWFEENTPKIAMNESLDNALLLSDVTLLPEGSFWKTFSTEHAEPWQKITNAGAKMKLFKHTTIDDHNAMKALRASPRIVFEFEDVDGPSEAVSMNANLSTYFESDRHVSVFERTTSIRKTRETDVELEKKKQKVIDDLDMYYDGENVAETTLIFLPTEEPVLTDTDFHKTKYKYHTDADKYLTLLEIATLDATSANLLKAETNDTKLYCLQANQGETKQKCTKLALMKTFYPSISPDMTSDAKKCFEHNTDICKNNMELLILPKQQEFKYQTCDSKALKTNQRLGLSLLSLYKFEQALKLLNDVSSNPLGYESLTFKAVKRNKPDTIDDAVWTNAETHDGIDFKWDPIKNNLDSLSYKELGQLKFISNDQFGYDMTNWGGFRQGGDYYKIVCVNPNENFVLNDTEIDGKFHDAQVLFLNYGASGLGFFNNPIAIWFWIVLAIIVFLLRVIFYFFVYGAPEGTSSLFGFSKKYADIETPGQKVVQILEYGVLALYFTIAFIAIWVAASNEYHKTEIGKIWGLSQTGEDRFDSLSGTFVATGVVVITVLLMTLLDSFFVFGEQKEKSEAIKIPYLTEAKGMATYVAV